MSTPPWAKDFNRKRYYLIELYDTYAKYGVCNFFNGGEFHPFTYDVANADEALASVYKLAEDRGELLKVTGIYHNDFGTFIRFEVQNG